MLMAAVDQGTTSTKCLLVEESGATREVGAIRHRQILPREGWVEHDANELLGNVRELIGRAVQAGAEVVALANQGETVVAWDRRTGEPLADAIVWQDQRTSSFVDSLRAAGREAELRAISGLPLDAYFSASKLRWILEEAPEARELARSGRLGLGTSDAFFLERLTGNYQTDPTTASRTSLMNLATCAWDTRLCDAFGVPIDQLPKIHDDGSPFGEIAVGGKAIPIRASVVDQVAALFGHGCRAPGDAKVTFGTGAFALAITGYKPPNDLPGGAIPTVGWKEGEARIYAADGGVYTAGAAIEWLLRIGLLRSAAELERIAGPPAIERGVAFVPALAGLACPHWDRSAAGLWIGMDSSTGREDLVKAVLEGIAFRTAEVLDALAAAVDCTGVLSVDGGLTRSRYFLCFFADLVGRRVVGAGEREITALGAGLLGLAAAGARVTQNTGATGAIYEPAAPPSQVSRWRTRFADARKRASGWRSPRLRS
jgi:glycerol kinase